MSAPVIIPIVPIINHVAYLMTVLLEYINYLIALLGYIVSLAKSLQHYVNVLRDLLCTLALLAGPSLSYTYATNCNAKHSVFKICIHDAYLIK